MLLDDTNLGSDAGVDNEPKLKFQARNQARLMAIARRNAGVEDNGESSSIDDEDDFDNDFDDDEADDVDQNSEPVSNQISNLNSSPKDTSSGKQPQSPIGAAGSGEKTRGSGGESKEGAINDSLKHELKGAARRKTQDIVADKLGSKIGNEGIRKGFESGMRTQGGYGKLAKLKGDLSKYSSVSNYAADKALQAGKAAGKKAITGAKNLAQGAKAAKGAQTAATAAKTAKAGAAAAKGLQAATTAAGAATGVETLGIGFIVAFLLNIAISLGVSDAIDAMFKLKEGDFKEARFLAIRAGTKVGMFVVLLLSVGLIFSVVGIFLAIPILICLNAYMLLGAAFKKVAIFQGFVWWEKAIIIFLDVMAFIIMLVFILALGWYLCDETGLGSGGVTGAATGAVVKVYDWWNKTNVGSVAEDFCKYTNQPSGAAPAASTTPENTNGPSGGGGDFGGAGAGGDF